MADNHNVDVNLFLSHPGYLDNQPERRRYVEAREVKVLQVARTKIGLSEHSLQRGKLPGQWRPSGKGGTEEPVRSALRMSTNLEPPL